MYAFAYLMLLRTLVWSVFLLDWFGGSWSMLDYVFLVYGLFHP